MKRLFLLATALFSAAAFATDTRVEVVNTSPISVSSTGAADTTGPNTTISGNSQCAVVLLTGQPAPGVHIAAGTLTATLTATLSDNATPATSDGNGNTCSGGKTCSCTGGTYPTAAKFSDASGNQQSSLTLTSPNAEAQWGITTISGNKCARVCSASSGTTGSAVLFLQATVAASPPPAAGADVTDRAARLLGVTYGSQGQQLKQSPTNFNAVSELAVGASLIDPRAIRALTTSDAITASQGGSWTVGLTGTVPLPTGAATSALQTTLSGQLPTLLDGSGFFKTHEQGTATVAGTVTANLGTLNGAALDATLTGGTQKAIARGGAKGASSAADVTSTAEGADHQALDVQLWLSGSALDPRTRSWTLSSGTDSVAATQSGSWNVGQSGSWTTTVTQATGSNLHAVTDTGSTTAVTQATGSNLHAQLDTGSTTAVTQATAANLNATVIGSGNFATTSAIQDPAYLAPASTSAPSKAPVVMGKTADGTPQYQPLPLAAGGGSVVVSGTLSSAGAADAVSTGAPTTFSSNAVCTGALLLAGQQSAGFQLNTGTLAATLTASYSMEASGTNFTTTTFSTGSTIVVTNPNALIQTQINLIGGARRVQVCTTSFTSGSATGFATATFIQSASSGGAASTVIQGNAGTNAQAWWTQIGDTTTGPVAVKAASTAAGATDKALVASLSPNSPLPAGTNVIGHTIADSGSTTAVTGNVTAVQTTGTNLHMVADTGSTTAVTALPATPAGTNLIGKVGIDQTTPGTTNGVQVNAALPAGTNVIGHTINDSGSTTAVTQATASNLNAQVQGPAASGASKSGNPVQTGAVFNTTQPTVTTGQAVENQATARGAQIVATGADTFTVTVASAPTTAVTIATLPALTTGSATIGAVTGPSAAALALDASVTGLEVAQGSTTSGQKGILEQCAVSTSAPTLTNGQTSPCSMDTGGNVRMVWSGTGNLQGLGTAGAPSGGVLTVQPPSSGSTTFPISGSLTPADTAGTLVTLSAACSTGVSCGANTTALVQLAGQNSANVTFSTGSSPLMTVVADCAGDGGTVYQLTGSPSTTGVVWFRKSDGTISQSITNPGNLTYNMVLPQVCSGATTARVRAAAVTSGTVNGQARAAANGQASYAGAIGANSYPPDAVALMTQDSSTATTSRAARSDANGLLVSQATAANLNATVIGGVSNDTSAIAAGVETLPAVARASGTATTAGRAEKLQISSGAGGLFVEGPVANGATAAGNPLGMAGVGRATSAAPTQVTAGQSSALTTDLEHRLWVAAEHPNGFSCTVDAASAQTQCIGASGASLSYYIKSVTFSASAAITFKVNSSTTAGNACATSPALVVPTMWFGANTGAPITFPQPIKVTANSALCCLPSGASGSCIIAGYIAP